MVLKKKPNNNAIKIKMRKLLIHELLKQLFAYVINCRMIMFKGL